MGPWRLSLEAVAEAGNSWSGPDLKCDQEPSASREDPFRWVEFPELMTSLKETDPLP